MQNEMKNLFQHTIRGEFRKTKVNFCIAIDNTEGNWVADSKCILNIYAITVYLNSFV